jgi:threonine aldolase
MIIDLRSDTVTKPSPGMLEAMYAAQLGDDVFEDDPTVNALEQKAAAMFGMEKALFCASGTMTNQIAINVHCKAGDEIICDEYSHIYLYEGGGTMANSHTSVKLLHGDRGRISAEMVAENINADNVHYPATRMVSLENTMNKGGGAIYDFDEILKIKKVCDENKLILHLDGARLANAVVESKETLLDFGAAFESISLCLSKGLGAPVGSLLLGNEAFVKQARRVRKRFGGGWRQAGFLAAAGIYALDNQWDRLKEDHARAKKIEEILCKKGEVIDILPVETNIVIFQLKGGLLAIDYVEKLKQKGILAATFGKDKVRFVTHLDFTDAHLEAFEKVIMSF